MKTSEFDNAYGEIMRERLEQRAVAMLGVETSSTSLSEPNPLPTLTSELLKQAVNKMEALSEKLFKDLLDRAGFDPDKTMIVFSAEAAEIIGLTEEGIPNSMQDQIRIDMLLEPYSWCVCLKPPFIR